MELKFLVLFIAVTFICLLIVLNGIEIQQWNMWNANNEYLLIVLNGIEISLNDAVTVGNKTF